MANIVEVLEENNTINIDEENKIIEIIEDTKIIELLKDEGPPVLKISIDDSLEGEGTLNNPIGLSNKSKTKYEIFTIDSTILSNKYVELSGIINDNQSIRVFLDNVGIKLEQGVDYSVSGHTIYWSGYNLSSLLELNDCIQIFYI